MITFKRQALAACSILPADRFRSLNFPTDKALFHFCDGYPLMLPPRILYLDILESYFIGTRVPEGMPFGLYSYLLNKSML